MTELLMGDEAVGIAAIDAGIRGMFSYPGTPATEIFEYVARRTAKDGRVSARWSANEKVAYEEALGMSFAGRRSLVAMKHVGLNVAADPFINSALTGAHGGGPTCSLGVPAERMPPRRGVIGRGQGCENRLALVRRAHRPDAARPGPRSAAGR